VQGISSGRRRGRADRISSPARVPIALALGERFARVVGLFATAVAAAAASLVAVSNFAGQILVLLLLVVVLVPALTATAAVVAAIAERPRRSSLAAAAAATVFARTGTTVETGAAPQTGRAILKVRQHGIFVLFGMIVVVVAVVVVVVVIVGTLALLPARRSWSLLPQLVQIGRRGNGRPAMMMILAAAARGGAFRRRRSLLLLFVGFDASQFSSGRGSFVSFSKGR